MTAARRFAAPELAISVDEATELQDALQGISNLTGFQPSGPVWEWLVIGWSVLSIYGFRLMEIGARKRREAEEAARTAAPPALPGPPGPAAPPAPARPPPAMVPPASNGAARPGPTPPPLVEPGGAISADARRLLDLNGGAIEGLTPPIPGVPRTSLEERTGGL